MLADSPTGTAVRRAHRHWLGVYLVLFLAALGFGLFLFIRSEPSLSVRDGLLWGGGVLALVGVGYKFVERPRVVRIYEDSFLVCHQNAEISVPFTLVRAISQPQWTPFVDNPIIVELRRPIEGIGRRFVFRPDEHVGLLAFEQPVRVEQLRKRVLG